MGRGELTSSPINDAARHVKPADYTDWLFKITPSAQRTAGISLFSNPNDMPLRSDVVITNDNYEKTSDYIVEEIAKKHYREILGYDDNLTWGIPAAKSKIHDFFIYVFGTKNPPVPIVIPDNLNVDSVIGKLLQYERDHVHLYNEDKEGKTEQEIKNIIELEAIRMAIGVLEKWIRIIDIAIKENFFKCSHPVFELFKQKKNDLEKREKTLSAVKQF